MGYKASMLRPAQGSGGDDCRAGVVWVDHQGAEHVVAVLSGPPDSLALGRAAVMASALEGRISCVTSLHPGVTVDGGDRAAGMAQPALPAQSTPLQSMIPADSTASTLAAAGHEAGQPHVQPDPLQPSPAQDILREDMVCVVDVGGGAACVEITRPGCVHDEDGAHPPLQVHMDMEHGALALTLCAQGQQPYARVLLGPLGVAFLSGSGARPRVVVSGEDGGLIELSVLSEEDALCLIGGGVEHVLYMLN